MKLRSYFLLANLIVAIVMVGLFFFGNGPLFILTYIIVFVIILARTLQTRGLKRIKLTLITIFSLLLAMQIVLCVHVVIFSDIARSSPEYWIRQFICMIVIAVPLVISRYVTVGKYAQFYLPSVAEAKTIGFSFIKENQARVSNIAQTASHTKSSFSYDNFKDIFVDLPRYDQLKYINEGSLTDEYFERAQTTLDDERIYIIISNTGSPASEIISVFTNNQFNHASLSFDRDLTTIISYNGGDRVYPPGLNPEMLSFFKKKDDASILVYSLPCARAQKEAILDRVREINRDGSAYNMLGLMTNKSYKPNIMFCSQFVYRMLELSELTYFKKDGKVEPTDFIELDYHRCLDFEYELEL